MERETRAGQTGWLQAQTSTLDTGNLQMLITILSFPQEIFSDPGSFPQAGNPPGKLCVPCALEAVAEVSQVQDLPGQIRGLPCRLR